jgi:penicillin-binding protein 2
MRKLLLKHRNRVLIIGLFLIFLYSILIIKLWQEQIRQGSRHREKISRQSIRRIRIPAARGKILTSDLHVLAGNTPSYDVYLYFEEMRQPRGRSKTITYIENALLQIDAILNQNKKISALDIRKHMNRLPGLPFKVASGISPRQMSKIFELSAKVKGLGIIPHSKRVYPAKDVAAHVIGYTRPEDPKKASDRKEYFYYLPDLKGVRGIEKQFDTLPFSDKTVRGLKGYPGFSLVQVDHRGFIHKTLIDEIRPLSGNNVVLTLDWRAQKIASDLMKDFRGAFVLLNADTGAVIAMVSSPSFDLQALSPKITSKAYQKLMKDPGKPLFSRATLGEYTPGSIMKPLVALTLLNYGIDPEETVSCDGKTMIAKARIRCSAWRRGGHGSTDLRHAIEQSCNDYFIEEGKRIKMEDLRDMFKSAGLGSITRLGLPERQGRLPAREDKKRITGFSWNQYDTSLLCIGQGYVSITPLQAAVYTAALSNGGVLYKPYLLKEIRSSSGTVLYRTTPQVSGGLDTSPGDLEIVQEAMHMVVNSPHGGGRLAENPIIELSGKTGTAELKVRGKLHQNTWFICFGKSKKINYAAAIIVEDGVSGGRTCAPVAKAFFMKYLSKKNKK